MKRALRAATLAVALVVPVPSVLSAGGSWLERAAEAPLQVVAVCQSRSSHWEGGSIFSDSEVSVLRVVRGAPDLTLSVRQRGGEVDGVGQKVSHSNLLEPGKSYLLFLSPNDGGQWTPSSKGVNPISIVGDLLEVVGGDPLEQVLSELGGGA